VNMKIFVVVLTIKSLLVMTNMVLTPPTITLLASSKGLKHYLTIDTNLNDDVRINTYQSGDRVFIHDAVIHSDSNEVTLQYLRGLAEAVCSNYPDVIVRGKDSDND
jgi:hypothetical protein